MNDASKVPQYQESRIEEEPLLGLVLTMPDGSMKPLTWFEKMMVALHITNAKLLEARHFKPVSS